MKLLQVCRVIRVGRGGLYILLPREAREKLCVQKGDELAAFLAEDGSLIYEKVERVKLTKN